MGCGEGRDPPCRAGNPPAIEQRKDRAAMTDRIYLQHPTRDETVAVNVGFSWPALLLGFIWALMKRLWGVALFMLGVNLALGVIGLAGITADLISLVLSIVFAIYCGMRANDWHRRILERKGYVVLPGLKENL
jgi:hypothetical protein